MTIVAHLKEQTEIIRETFVERSTTKLAVPIQNANLNSLKSLLLSNDYTNLYCEKSLCIQRYTMYKHRDV